MRSAIPPLLLLVITNISLFHDTRRAAARNSIDFTELRRAGRSSGNLVMSSMPNPASGSETSGREDFNVGDKDAVVIVDHGSRRQESNLMLSNKPDSVCTMYLLH